MEALTEIITIVLGNIYTLYIIENLLDCSFKKIQEILILFTG